jgi:tubulin polyglutamylase TTLL6/13
MWADHAIALERMAKFKPYQRCSQLPGIGCITRKNCLGGNLNNMKEMFPEEYNFFPNTYLFPKDRARLKKEWDGNSVLIVKPYASCQGKGIYLTREVDDISEEYCVVQLYIDKPYLMEELKFDLRLYVLVTGINPLRIYLSKDGLCRLSTKMYEEVDDKNL